MGISHHPSLIRTRRERCRVCYTCVRECPAKAIRIVEGQADIVVERCIGCGNCVRVCSQNAKQPVTSLPETLALLSFSQPVAACLAPSYPAEFERIPPETLVGMLRQAGFRYVHETAFGADLVARAYRRLIERNPNKRFIASTCPAIVSFVESYHPDQIDCLAPVVSPMTAQARVIRKIHGQNVRVVFIGPCIAKKGEAATNGIRPDVDTVLTFAELRELFEQKKIGPDTVSESEFDPPRAGTGVLFPVSRGILQAAGIKEDLMDGAVVAADGRLNFAEAIKEFQHGHLDAGLLEVLCCQGCIMGAGMTSTRPMFHRRSLVSKSARRQRTAFDRSAWLRHMAQFRDLDLNRIFHPDDQRMAVPAHQELRKIMARMGKRTPGDELNCGACGYETCREHAVAIYKHLAENEMCLPYTIEQLKSTVKQLNLSNEQLARTQEALMQSEKLASMGQLAAGIAHELNNPLGVVLMYSHLMLDGIETQSPLRGDAAMIAEQADRCKKIVSGLLHFARQNKVSFKTTDIRQLIVRALHASKTPRHIHVELHSETAALYAEIDPDQILQVLTNIIENAVDAMPGGGTLTLNAQDGSERFCVEISDHGTGIPPEHRAKIFEPFFTTKQIGKGTGLGLAVSYGIVKMHCGRIEIESNADPGHGPTGSTFRIILPHSPNNTLPPNKETSDGQPVDC